MLVYSSPRIVFLAVGFHLDFGQILFISWLWTSSTQLSGIDFCELMAPVAGWLVSHAEAKIKHHPFDISIAQGKCVVELEAVRDALGGKAMTPIAHAHLLSHAQTGGYVGKLI